MEKIKVEFKGKKSFISRVRGHVIVSDLPADKGGEDSAPTAPELFVASIASCMGIYVASYLKTAGLDPEGLSLDVEWDMDQEKKKIGYVKVNISVPGEDPGARKKAILAAAEKCLLHSTLKNAPEIITEIS